MMFVDKTALVFAATGAIASEVARTFAREGAAVYLSGRDSERLAQLCAQIRDAGGHADAEVVDATDPQAVAAYVDQVARRAGQLDIVFNGIGGRPVELGYPALSTSQDLDDFLKPLQRILGSTFLTSRTVGAHMIRQNSGAIVTLSATLSGMAAAGMAGISATCGAIEALTCSLAGEFGPAGVRVNCVRGSAMPETRTIQETGAGLARLFEAQGGMGSPIGSEAPLRRPITVAETARVAAFLASEAASGMTGQVVTVCGGAFVG